MEVVDAHVHCGESYTFDEYFEKIKETTITQAVVFPLASDIYDRHHRNFQDNDEWKEKRESANNDVLKLTDQEKRIKIHPFKFVWNDFNMENFDRYFGAKWHRHRDDAQYDIGSDKFVRFISALRKRRMPIIFEDDLDNTMKFIKKWAKGINVIIPHLGYENGGYDKLEGEGVWRRANVYTDTPYADISLIRKYIENYGHDRILFGSDHPNLGPEGELEKISCLLNPKTREAITSKNILRLLEGVRK